MKDLKYLVSNPKFLPLRSLGILVVLLLVGALVKDEVSLGLVLFCAIFWTGIYTIGDWYIGRR